MKKYLIILFLFFSVFSNTISAQWKKLGTLPFSIGIIYFQHLEGRPNTGFAGTWIQQSTGNRNFFGELWKTSDGGKLWKKVSGDGWPAGVRDIHFKDSLTGWVATGYIDNSGNYGGACYKTIDGGETWNPLFGATSHYSGLFYNKKLNLLFVNCWVGETLVSNDEGATFQKISGVIYGNGFSFWDTDIGIQSKVSQSGITFFPFYKTIDGGLSWYPTNFIEESWQTLAINNTSSIVAMCEYTKKIYRSDDFGDTWLFLNQFFEPMSGCIGGNQQHLYIQTRNIKHGILESNDGGVSWSSICGPSNGFDTRFQVINDSIYATDEFGRVWLNTSSKGTGPRLQIEKDSVSRSKTGFVGDIFPIDIYYSKEAYNELVDSLSFTIRSADPVILLSDSVAAGWSVVRSIDTNNVITYWLKRTDASAPPLDSFLIRLYFQATVAPEKTGFLTLDEINFNNDVTFRDCMVASLTAMDSFEVNIEDKCGDSTIREFLLGHNLPLKIVSLRPNPAQNEVTVELDAAEGGVALMEVYDELGNRVMGREISFAKGRQRVTISTADIAEGMYSVRMGNVSGRFVKVK